MANRSGKQKKKRYRELQRKLKSRPNRANPAQAKSRSKKVAVGFTARRGIEMVCDRMQSCVVCGSRSTMEMFLHKHDLQPQDHTIEPASAAQILQGISMGGMYALERYAYERFYPAGLAAGLELGPLQVPEDPPEGIWLIQVGW